MKVEISDGYIPFGKYKTYYRIANPKGKKTPLLALHGGPGSTHNSLELLDDLANIDDRPIVCYDQFGCGKSSIDDENYKLYNKEMWVKQLIDLREKLKLNKIHLFGHSWGGMLEIIYLTDYNPNGILSITLASTLSSASLWEKECKRLIKYLPKEDQEIINGAKTEEAKESEEYKRATEHFISTFVKDPLNENTPECLTRKKENGQVSYVTAWGNNEFSPTGNLKDYQYSEKLNRIKCPVLITSGVDDESTPLQNKIMYDNITSKKRWELFDNSKHLSYYTQHDEYVKVLKEFLDENDN